MESKPILSRFRNSITAQSIRRGLTLAIPFLTLGSFSLLFLNLPSDSYQTFLHNFLNGSAVALLTTLYNVSLGSLALVLCITTVSYTHLDVYKRQIPHTGRRPRSPPLSHWHDRPSGTYWGY